MGEKYGKTAAQVALRWLLQSDVIIIPKTVHKERMQENLNLFDFELDAEDMQKIAVLDTAPTVSSSTIIAEKQPSSLWSGELW
ncbi:aldo/keto reductase [Segatella hominis]|uniref:aldo/keto reductase n=1 Tax=Segatella hominis TaxID=2518605 RepID=UPI0035277DF4